jgi:hypothetical protein
VVRCGSGTIPTDMTPLRDVLDEFKVFCGGFEISVKPKAGTIFADSQCMALVAVPCKLVWFRRMSMELGTHDKNTAAPQCLWYGLGLQSGTEMVGYRIQEDGTAQWGGLE